MLASLLKRRINGIRTMRQSSQIAEQRGGGFHSTFKEPFDCFQAIAILVL